MKVDLAGKIKNTHLPRSKALLPLFEAVINSFQAIEEVSKALPKPAIEIVVERDPVLPDLEIDGDVNGFLVTDDGIGFTPAKSGIFLHVGHPIQACQGRKRHRSLYLAQSLRSR